MAKTVSLLTFSPAQLQERAVGRAVRLSWTPMELVQTQELYQQMAEMVLTVTV
jgi:hypothetical protein